MKFLSNVSMTLKLKSGGEQIVSIDFVNGYELEYYEGLNLEDITEKLRETVESLFPEDVINTSVVMVTE